MDVSLDDYINKSNFKVKIGNPNFKGQPNVRQTVGGGFHTGKKRFVAGFQANKVTDVSITVPAVRKTASNTNRTNPVRDARDKLSIQPKPQDARDRLNQRQQNVDARQKLITIRAKKEPFDARAKIQAKKQQAGQPDKKSGPLALTRTVANQNTQMTVPEAQQITRTLTKVMPPGYENIAVSTNSPTKQQQTKGLSSVKLRLGPPQACSRDLQNITVTRTVPNVNTQTQRQFVKTKQPLGAPHQPAQFHVPEPAAPALSFHLSHYSPPQQGLPPDYNPPPPQFQSYQAPPPQPQYNPPYPTHPYPIPQTPHPPPATAPVPQNPPTQLGTRPNPPYPIEDNIGVIPKVPQHPSMSLPKIQVHNDQYCPQDQPQYQPFVAQSHQPYPQAQYSGYATSPQYLPDHRSIPSPESQYVKTIQNTAQPAQTISHPSHPSLKRKSTESSGQLRMSSTNSIPVIGSLERSGPASSSVSSDEKFTRTAPQQEPPVKKPRDETSDGDVISPLQGFKVLISNLNSTVTQDDVIELFGSIGAVKKVRLAKGGLGEVIYVKKEDAVNAVKNYHERELDGLPMVVKVATSLTAKVKEVQEKLPTSGKPAAEPLKLYKKQPGGDRVTDKKGVEVAVLHKALFKTGAVPSTKPVTFTVNI